MHDKQILLRKNKQLTVALSHNQNIEKSSMIFQEAVVYFFRC